MSPAANPRKRPAPDSHPTFQSQQMNQSYAGVPSQPSNEQYEKWDPSGVDNMNFPDPTGLNNMGYGTNQPNPQFQQSLMMPQTQIARRPMNRQLVATGPRATYDGLNGPWGPFSEDGSSDPHNLNGPMDEHESVEKLEEKAAIAKREAQAKRKQIPPFVQKLSSFLDESKNTDLIRWSDKGDSFIVLDEDEFAKTLIPELFKHNNYASFVRQLNMYGFHKRVGLSDNSMKASERKNKSPSEYYNPYFRRGHPNLLWLINKPKGGTGQKKGKGSRVKSEDGGDGDSDEEIRDGVDENYAGQYGQTQTQGVQPALPAAPTSGPLQRREMQVVQSQLQEIQKQQSAISNAIARLRKDHNQLYQQAIAFQTLHDRHESSINAILTFLATVYNRSLDGQGVPNIAQMFSGAIPQDQQGSVVDMGDVNNQSHDDTGASPQRRPQRLLMAPPTNKQGTAANTPSSATSSGTYGANMMNMSSYRPQQRTGSVEEVFESPSTENPRIKSEPDTNSSQLPQQNIMSLINNTNAQMGRTGSSSGMKFPEIVSHYGNINGNAPLTPEQRHDVLNMMAPSLNAASGTNNALVSPTPPPQPSLDQMDLHSQELDNLMRMQHEQANKLRDITQVVQPLSPSGIIPGLNDNSYYNNNAGDISPLSGNNIDLDQFLDSGAYYNNSDPNDYNFDSFDTNSMNPGVDGSYNFNVDGTADGLPGDIDGGGRIVETTGSSEGATPEDAVDQQQTQQQQQASPGPKSPSKRRRKN